MDGWTRLRKVVNVDAVAIGEVARSARVLMHTLAAADQFAARITSHGDERSTISGTGGYGTESNATLQGHLAYRLAYLKGLSVLTPDEAVILAAGLFFQGSDVYDHVAKSQRGISTNDLTTKLAQVHEAAFNILAKSGLGVRSRQPRSRVVTTRMLGVRSISEKKLAPDVWSGTLREQSTLCTAESFEALGPLYEDERAPILVSICNVETIAFSRFSPFPDEEEWIAAPNQIYDTIVVKRGKRMPDACVDLAVGHARRAGIPYSAALSAALDFKRQSRKPLPNGPLDPFGKMSYYILMAGRN